MRQKFQTKTAAIIECTHRYWIKRPGGLRAFCLLNGGTHRLCAWLRQRANVNQQRTSNSRKLTGLFGFDNHRWRCTERQQGIGGKGLHHIIGHAVHKRGMLVKKV